MGKEDVLSQAEAWGVYDSESVNPSAVRCTDTARQIPRYARDDVRVKKSIQTSVLGCRQFFI